MRTALPRGKCLYPALTCSVFLGWSAGASAASEDKAVEVTKVAAPTAATNSAAAVASAEAPAETAPTGEQQPAPDPAAVTQVGFQRLPSTAYPGEASGSDGLPYGSLWLTFHGQQWPYMPATGTVPRFMVGLSGWGWVDTSYEKFSPWTSSSAQASSISQDNVRQWIQQARLLLRVTPTYSLSSGYFVQGQAELVGTEDQTINRGDLGGADTDNLWLRLGQWKTWDFQVGRFEGWEVFHLGMGLDQNTYERNGAVGPYDAGNYNISFYGLTDNQFRPSGAAGNLAVHYYPLRFLRFEVLGTVGNSAGYPMLATRPVAILDLGWLKLKGGVEYQHLSDKNPSALDYTTKKGLGGAIQFVFLPHIEFGLNAAQGTVWSVDQQGRYSPTGSYTRTSVGGFANVSNGNPRHPLLFGVGGMYTQTEDQNNSLGNGEVDKIWLWQSFAAVQYVAFQQLYIKLVAGYSRGHWSIPGPVAWDDEMYSLRLRFSLYF